MLVWQSRLNKDFPFEFVIQESSGKGYKKIEHKYTTAYVADADPSRVFQAVFAMKMIEKAEALLKEVDSGITVEVDIPDEVEEELKETYEEVTEAEKEEAEEVEEKKEKQTYEIEVGGVEYEVEIPEIEVEHVKRAGILKRLKSRKGKELKEMEAMGEFEIEHDVGGIEYEIELKKKS
jgi:hypothetical protein